MVNNKTIAISGATGFIGSHITTYFKQQGYNIITLNRDLFGQENSTALSDALAASDIVINLAGTSISRRWTKKKKQEIYESRLKTTCAIVSVINDLKKKPSLFISASAVGYYPSVGYHDEYSNAIGDTFLSEVCQKWEQQAQKVSPQVRTAITRLGVVLAPKGGAFEQMAMPSKMGVSAIMGSGNQPFAWIDIKDVTKAFEHIINDTSLHGTFNLVSPQIISNKELTKILTQTFKSKLTICIPSCLLKIVLGEASQIVCKGQRIKPTRLLESGFQFSTPTIVDFCNILR